MTVQLRVHDGIDIPAVVTSPGDWATVCLVTDASGRIRWGNEKATRLLREVGGGTLTDLVRRDDRENLEHLLRDVTATGGPLEVVVRLRTPDGVAGSVADRHLHLLLSPAAGTGGAADAAGTPEVLVQGWDVTLLVRKIRELEVHAYCDPLTGLANRLTFLDRLRQEVARSARSGTDVAVLFADVDRLKTVNDTYGHEAGDDVLVGLARRLTAALRPQDTLARVGGDEFAVVCADLDDSRQALAVVERLRSAAAEPLAIRGRHVSVTLSVGIAFASAATDDDPVSTLLRRADEAMYDLKLGRGPAPERLGSARR